MFIEIRNVIFMLQN